VSVLKNGTLQRRSKKTWNIERRKHIMKEENKNKGNI